MYSPKIETALLFAGVLTLTLFSQQVRAQSTPPSAIGNTAPPNIDSLPPRAFDNVRPAVQENLFDSNNGSQQFFRQGQDRLYFLPEDKSEPILNIDEAVKTEETKENRRPNN